MTSRQVQLIENFKATTIMVTPSYMPAILEECRALEREPRNSPLEVGIVGAEPWTNAMRGTIADAFDKHAVDIFGLSEIIGPGVANECVESKDGPHVWEDHFYPEIIDPKSRLPVADGELVFTALTKEAQPVIRYRTRDLSRLMPGTARSMRRMRKVTGRLDDMIIIIPRGVNLHPSQTEEHILALSDLAPHFQIELLRKGLMDSMKILVGDLPSSSDAETRGRLARQLQQRVRNRIGVSVTADVTEPGGVPRSQGKAVRIIDRRQ